VPSTEKWSLDNNLLTLSCDSTAARNWLVTSPQQPVPVLSEARGVPHIVLDAEPDKPAEQHVVVDPLDQLPLRTDRTERLQQQGAPQTLQRARDPRPIGDYSLASSPDSDLSAALAIT
jgi:hypothetical protein